MKEDTMGALTGVMAIAGGKGAQKMGPNMGAMKPGKGIPKLTARQNFRANMKAKATALPKALGRGAKKLFSAGKGGAKALQAKFKKWFGKKKKDVDGPDAAQPKNSSPTSSKHAPNGKDLGSFDGKKVKSEVDFPDGHKGKVLNDGQCAICSNCKKIRERFKRELADIENSITFKENLTIGITSGMFGDLQTLMKNIGSESYGLAVAMKGISAAEAGINSLLAFTQALTLPFPLNWIQGGLVLAAGLAKQAAILSTPIPTAQTGLSNYTVPDTFSNRNDGAAVMAQGGEKVSITPRGENEKGNTYNFELNGEVFISFIQDAINKGRIDVNNRNMGRGVFAT
jgi:hypothetical protein